MTDREDCSVSSQNLPTPANSVSPPVGTATQSMADNPVTAYLLSLGSQVSREKTASHLRQIVRLVHRLPDGAPVDIFQFNWAEFDYVQTRALIEVMRQESYSPESIKAFLSAVRGVLREAFILGQVPAEQLERVRSVKPPRESRIHKGRLISSDEFMRMLDACSSDVSIKGVRDYCIISVLLNCGLRRAELVNLDLEDCNLSEGVMLIKGKGNKERLAFLNERTLDSISKWLEWRGHEAGPLFVRLYRNGNLPKNIQAGRMSDQAVYDILNNRRVQAGLEPLSPHDLRRTLASTLLDQGFPIEDVRDVLGHSSVKTTERYDLRSTDRLKKKMRKFSF